MPGLRSGPRVGDIVAAANVHPPPSNEDADSAPNDTRHRSYELRVRVVTNATNSGEDLMGWAVGFHSESRCEWSDGLAKLPETLADAQVTRWQRKYGRELEPTVQRRSWLTRSLTNKIRTDIAMVATKLNAQVIIRNLQNMHEKSLPPTGART